MVFCVLLIINTISSINAEANNEFSLQVANYGTGVNFLKKQINLELSAEIFNLFFENYIKNTGLKISPLNIRAIFGNDEAEQNTLYEMNLLNICSYWNLLDEEEYIFGPFCSLQYFGINNWEKIDLQNITVNSGLKFIVKSDDYNFIGKNYSGEMEIGYRYNYYNGHQIYVNMKVDLITSFIFIGKIGQFFNSNQRNDNIIN